MGLMAVREAECAYIFLASAGPLLPQPTPSLALCKAETFKPCFQDLPARILSPCRRDSGNSQEGRGKSRSSDKKESDPWHPRVQRVGKETQLRLREPRTQERRAQSPSSDDSSQDVVKASMGRGLPEGDHSPR